MKNLFKLSLLFLLVFGVSSCMFDGVKGNGNVITKKRKISDDFIRIKASRGLEVYITKSRNVSLEVEADENLHELIETEVRDGTLVITSSKNIWEASAKKIHLSIDQINEIDVSSGAEIYSENTFSSERLSLDMSSGSQVKMDLKVEELSCSSSSGAGAKLTGRAEHFTVSSSSGSDIKAYGLATRSCVADVSSGANIKVHVTESIRASASSGGNIKYKGNPEEVSKEDNSGGNVYSTDS
jgi:hypothetical protein